ncbi:MAG: glutamate--cysteine ligase, partial [Gammaproteobacteria bacterium]
MNKKSPPENLMHVPHLATAVSGPLHYIEEELLAKQPQIEAWLRKQWHKTPAHITCSVDLRNAGFKLAPVDTNLFPAGFNNISPDLHPLCIQAAQTVLNEQAIDCKNILLIPETHSKNPFYWQSLATLQNILSKAGYQVR